MPWYVERTAQCPAARPWGVILNADGKVVDGGCHSAHDMANRHMAALYANEPKMGGRAALLVAAGPFLNELPHLREQPRDSHGRFDFGEGKTDAGSGSSPAKLHDDEATLRATYNYHDPQTGFTAEVVGIRSAGAGFTTYVDVRITDSQGNPIGGAERGIRPAGQASVIHAGMVLDPQFQGQGFATRYNAQAEASYRANGIQQIEIHASGGGPFNGGYTWAKAGYDFTGSSRHEVAAMVTREHAPNYAAPIQAQFTKIAADPHASPIDYAMVGWKPGATTWPGKEVMTATSWDGVKTL